MLAAYRDLFFLASAKQYLQNLEAETISYIFATICGLPKSRVDGKKKLLKSLVETFNDRLDCCKLDRVALVFVGYFNIGV